MYIRVIFQKTLYILGIWFENTLKIPAFSPAIAPRVFPAYDKFQILKQAYVLEIRIDSFKSQIFQSKQLREHKLRTFSQASTSLSFNQSLVGWNSSSVHYSIKRESNLDLKIELSKIPLTNIYFFWKKKEWSEPIDLKH